MDVDLRSLERKAALGDPQAEAQLAVARVRAGRGVGAWYAENLAPLDVPEEDFQVLLRVLVRGPRGSRGPRKWSWLAVPQDEPGRRAGDVYVLAVRTTHRRPDNQEFFDDTITVGFTEAARQIGSYGAPRIHPHEAWQELSLVGLTQTPFNFYEGFEEKFRGPDVPEPETPRWMRHLEILPSGTTTRTDGLVGGHGCKSGAPLSTITRDRRSLAEVHADDPTHAMYRWARRSAPDRVVIPVMDARVYVGLDPLTGMPHGVERNPHRSLMSNGGRNVRSRRRNAGEFLPETLGKETFLPALPPQPLPVGEWVPPRVSWDLMLSGKQQFVYMPESSYEHPPITRALARVLTKLGIASVREWEDLFVACGPGRARVFVIDRHGERYEVRDVVTDYGGETGRLVVRHLGPRSRHGDLEIDIHKAVGWMLPIVVYRPTRVVDERPENVRKIEAISQQIHDLRHKSRTLTFGHGQFAEEKIQAEIEVLEDMLRRLKEQGQ